ncbi:hypothetical protein ACSTI0_00730, partial [Vibrio parahaemolyticus]
SARTAAAFLESGLGADKQIHILTLHHDHKEGSKIAGHAVEYLHAHGLKVQPHVISDHDVKDTVFEQLSELNAELLVMGAFGHSAVHEHFFG